MVLGSSPVTVFFCCHQESACFSFSLLSSIFSTVFFTFPNLCRKDSLSFLSLPLHLCLKSKHANVFTTCKERKCSRNKKRSFLWLCHRISFSPSEHFQGGKVVKKCHLYFRGKSDWHYSGLLIFRAGQRQQPGVTNRTLPLCGRDEQTEDNRNQLRWVAGLWWCRKSSIILTLKIRK